jgi:type VI secretion system secreted protein VgrG
MTDSLLPETTFAFATDGVTSDAWEVVRFVAREEMSSLFTVSVVLSMDPTASPLESLLGTTAVLAVGREHLTRNFRGMVREVEDLGSTAVHSFVRVEVVPALWSLTQRSDSRIFQQMNVTAIVREVLRVAGVYQRGGELEIDASLDAHPPREYCVQYQETDLDFVRRLLEEEGIPFYFRHQVSTGDTLVLAGDTHVYPDVAIFGGNAVPILDAGLATHTTESARWFDERHQLQPTSVTVRDFDFSRPRTAISPSFPSRPGPRALYESPARASLTAYDEASRTYQIENAARLARVRQEAFQTRTHVGRGKGNVTGFTPGFSFTLDGHEHDELNRTYLVTETEHVGLAWSDLPEDVSSSERVLETLRDAGVSPSGAHHGRIDRYTNRFTVLRMTGIETSVAFRPLRTIQRPIVEGPQTAWVVGPAGEEIYTDPHGRIKVQFHWDRLGQNNERSSCWIRTAQSSSGAAWGFTILPRIGMEVVVSFLEGDPDRPMVTACVTNGANGSPYGLPDMKTRSVIKTQSSPFTGGYNELRFEDKAGDEQMFVQAERNHDTLVKNDQTVTVRNNRTKLIQGNEHNVIEQNRITKVVQNYLRQVDGNHDVEIHGPQGATLSVDTDRTVWVGGSQSFTIDKSSSLQIGENSTTTIGGDAHLAIEGDSSIQVTKSRSSVMGVSDSTTVGSSFSISVAPAGAPMGSYQMHPGKTELTTGLGATITLEGSNITLKADTIFFDAKNIYGAATETISFGGGKGVSMGSASGEAKINGKTLVLSGVASSELTSTGPTTVSGTPVQLNGPGLFAGRVTELAPATITTGAALVLVGGASFPYEVVKLPDGSLKIGDHLIVKPGTTDPNFQNKVVRDLGIMSSTPSGLERLDNIQKNPGGHDVTIREYSAAEAAKWGENNSLAYSKGGDPMLSYDSKGNPVPGKGGPTEIAYNPQIQLGPSGTSEPADAVLFHEMGHAEHNAYGVNRANETMGGGWGNREEWQTIEGGVNRPGNTNDIPGVPRSPSENGYLGDRNYPYRRTDHGSGYSNPDGTPIRP